MLFSKKSTIATSHEIDDAVLTLTEKDTARLEWPLDRRRSTYFFVLGVLLLGVFAGRLAYLNLIRGGEYQTMAQRNSLRSLVLVAPRGIIYDRFGEPLVQNEPSLDAVIVPNDLPQDATQRSQVLERAKAFFEPETELWESLVKRLEAKSLQPVLVRSHVEQGLIVKFLTERKQFPGVVLMKSAEREYIDGKIFSHLLGYEGKYVQKNMQRLRMKDT